MERMVIGFPRRTEEATWSGGSWQTAYPLANIAVHSPLARVARSTDATTASTQFTATFPSARGLRVLALVRHNISLAGRWRVRIWSDESQTVLVYDSDWIDVWPRVYPLPDSLDWEDDRYWLEKYGQAEIDNVSAARPLWLDGIKLARVVKIEIDDTTNPAGYVQIGLCELAHGFQTSVSMAFGYAQGFRFRTQEAEALSGVKYFDRRDKPRKFSGEIPYLPRIEAMAQFFELLRQYDLDIPFLFFPFPDETVHWLRTVALVRNIDPGMIARVTHNRDRVPFAFEEVL